ncbi:MAG: hmrR [Klenkia sp.]|nr:hmrR [Klenkia sp.]
MREAGTLQIGEVADRIGLSLRTIRHYDEVGLAVPSARSDGGFRLYVEADVERLRVVMQMKPLGFSLEEMRELLQVLADGGPADRLTHFRTAAAERVAGLHRQLATAEAFAERLASTGQ